MQPTRYNNKHPKKSLRTTDSKKLLYDARGVRVQKSRFSGGFYNTLLYWVLPFLVINLLIFTLVTATPKVEVQVAETNDYKTTTVTFSVKSMLPVKSVTALWEYAEPLELTQDGKTYTAQVTKNGNISFDVTSLNGMSTRIYENIDILDSTPPQVNPDDCEVSPDKLTIKITDSQSGVNFDSVYATDPQGRKITPSSIDKETGTVEFAMYLGALEVYAEDMVGNPMQANFSTTVDGMEDTSSDTDESQDVDIDNVDIDSTDTDTEDSDL